MSVEQDYIENEIQKQKTAQIWTLNKQQTKAKIEHEIRCQQTLQKLDETCKDIASVNLAAAKGKGEKTHISIFV